MQEKSGLPVCVLNDANAAALGEYSYGAGKECSSAVMISIGTGIGSGIVFDGKLFEGNGGAGAGLEHEVIRMGGGISAQGETLTKPLQRKLNALKLGGKNSASVKIVAATLGNDAGIYGAAECFSDRSE